MLTLYLGDLENMRVLDLIVYYMRNEKKDHTASRAEICGTRYAARKAFIDSWGCPTIQKREKKEDKYGFISKKKQNFLCQKQLWDSLFRIPEYLYIWHFKSAIF